MAMSRLILVLGVLSHITVLSGCAGSHISPESKVIASIPDKSANFQVGKADREAIRGALGGPLYSSSYWGFDLFRDEAEQSETAIAITPWPIPFARLTDKLRRYTLITYDAANHVSSLKSGIFRRVPNWRSVTPIQNDYLSLGLHGGDLTLLLDPRIGGENLMIEGAGRDAFFKRLEGSTGCAIVVGTGSHGLSITVSVDGSQEEPLPTRVRQADEFNQEVLSETWIDTLVAIKLAVGEHDLVFASKYIGENKVLRYACQPGDVRYLQVNSRGTGKTSTLQFDRWDSIPTSFVERPLVIIYDGEWQVEVEPGN